jgi:zinc and cadmium transporter
VTGGRVARRRKEGRAVPVSELQTLGAYSAAILAGAVTGGALPLIGRTQRSDALLSFSAGVMLGAAFLHMLPEAVEGAGLVTIPWVLFGFLVLFLLERFVLVHVCAEPGPSPRLVAEPAPAPESLRAHPGHAHAHEATGCEVHTLGLAAFVGLSLHTMVDGFALGAANSQAALGMFVFLAILAHKVPASFSLSSILRAEGYGRRQAMLMNATLALMVPLGAALYLGLRNLFPADRFTACALAASAGTFLHLALSDILPDLHRRGGSRLRLSGALVAGVVLMWGLRMVGHP